MDEKAKAFEYELSENFIPFFKGLIQQSGIPDAVAYVGIKSSNNIDFNISFNFYLTSDFVIHVEFSFDPIILKQPGGAFDLQMFLAYSLPETNSAPEEMRDVSTDFGISFDLKENDYISEILDYIKPSLLKKLKSYSKTVKDYINSSI